MLGGTRNIPERQSNKRRVGSWIRSALSHGFRLSWTVSWPWLCLDGIAGKHLKRSRNSETKKLQLQISCLDSQWLSAEQHHAAPKKQNAETWNAKGLSLSSFGIFWWIYLRSQKAKPRWKQNVVQFPIFLVQHGVQHVANILRSTGRKQGYRKISLRTFMNYKLSA